MADRKIKSGDMFEGLVAFVTETLPEMGMVYPDDPDIFILVAGRGDDLTFHSTSNSHKRTLDVLNRAVLLQKETKRCKK